MKNITEKFEAEIAKAISLILAASQAAAVEALREAFAKAGSADVPTAAVAQRTPGTTRRSSSSRRNGAEIAALEERVFDAILATPGEPMSVLAPRVESTPSALQVPVARLKAAGRIKTVGARQFTRYFPIERSAVVEQDTAA